MAKTKKISTKDAKIKANYGLHPWTVQHHPKHSEIEAYSGLTGQWEVIADINGAHHVELAEFILATMNAHNQTPNKYEEAIRALELCLECKGLTWEAEQSADIVVRKARTQG